MTAVVVSTDAALDTLLSSLTEDTVTAHIHWRLFKDLRAAVPEFVAELNMSPAFWSYTFNAHRDVTLFRLSRLFDQQRNALSLRTLLDTIATNVHFFDENPFRARLSHSPFVDSLAQDARRPDEGLLSTDRTSMTSQSDSLVKRFVDARNQKLVHLDPGVVLGTKRDPTDRLNDSDIEALLERAKTIVGRYGILFRASVSQMSIIGQDDYRDVLMAVRRSHFSSGASR